MMKLLPLLIFGSFFLVSTLIAQNGYRTIDGADNNLLYTNDGQTNVNFERLAPAQYSGDGSTMIDRANARIVSNTLCAQSQDILSNRDLSAYMFTWLQFLDHDITFTEQGDESAPISVPTGDVYFDPFNTGEQVISFTRVGVAPNTGSSNANPREQVNELTAWLDASNVYGSDEDRATWLRAYDLGKLKVSPSPNGDLLPCNTTTGNCADEIDTSAPEMDGNEDPCGNHVKVFVAGDFRANEQPGLTTLHTLFVREHNRICDELIANGQTNDEANYQHARKIVGGLLQAITYYEVLPALGVNLDNYSGYKPIVSPNIFNEFATAAYRLGHTMITEDLSFLNAECSPATIVSGCGEGTAGIFGGASCLSECTTETITGSVDLRDAFFNPSIIGNNGLDAMLRGLGTASQQAVDLGIVEDVRSFLFGAPGSGGLDLAAINIQRGRDHGLADYNTIREALGLSAVNSFSQITADLTAANAMQELYGNVNNIDAWIGMLAENHLPNSEVGETLHELLKLQFENIRAADRFWFEIDDLLTNQEKTSIKASKLADVINRNTTINNLSDVFFRSDCQGENSFDYCDAVGNNATYEYIDNVVIGTFSNNSGNDNGHGDFGNMNVTASLGESMNVALSPGFSAAEYMEHWGIWIDFNQDGDFNDANENVFEGNATSTISGSMSIPSNVITGTTGLRIAMRWNNAPSACGTIAYGEVEDYSIKITGELNCTLTGQACNDADDCTVNDTYNADCNCIGFFQDSDADGSCDAADPCPADPSDSCISVDYCTASGANTGYEYIQSVQLGTINNNSGNDNGYGDYINLMANLNLGGIATINLTPGFSAAVYKEYWTVWIDFNQDGDFDDSNETVFNDNGKEAVSGPINIPSNAKTGTTRMRIAMKWNSVPTACDNINYGEVEDYTVNIQDNLGLSLQNDTFVTASTSSKTALDDLKIYPNPIALGKAINLMYLAHETKELPLQVFSMTGQLVYQTIIAVSKGENQLELPIQNLEAGIYTLSYDDGVKITGKRFILIR